MKTEDLLVLAAIGAGAFVLFKPLQKTGGAIADTISQVGGGVGTAVQGLGGGVADIAGGLGSPFEFVDLFLEEKIKGIQQANDFQRAFDEQANIYELQRAKDVGQIKGQIQVAEVTRDLIKKDKKTVLTGLEAQSDITKKSIKETGSIERVEDRQDFYTDVQGGLLDRWKSRILNPDRSVASSWYSNAANIAKNLLIRTNPLLSIVYDASNVVRQSNSNLIGRWTPTDPQVQEISQPTTLNNAIEQKASISQPTASRSITRIIKKTPSSAIVGATGGRSSSFVASSGFAARMAKRGIV